MTAVGDARKRQHPAPHHFVATDALGSQVIWRGTGTRDPHAQPVLEGWRVMRDDPELWAAIRADGAGRCVVNV